MSVYCLSLLPRFDFDLVPQHHLLPSNKCSLTKAKAPGIAGFAKSAPLSESQGLSLSLSLSRKQAGKRAARIQKGQTETKIPSKGSVIALGKGDALGFVRLPHVPLELRTASDPAPEGWACSPVGIKAAPRPPPRRASSPPTTRASPFSRARSSCRARPWAVESDGIKG